MDEAFLPHVFDEFKQESTGISRNHEGTGLGMAITKRFVEAMGGMISVESVKGQGTRFTLSFPRAQPSAGARNGREQQEPRSASSARPARQASIRILAAEDNLVNQKVVCCLLKWLGYTADVVANGLEALDVLEHAAYDVVLMDMQMPVMNGLDATRQICARYDAAERPHIIALTANSMAGDRDRCLEAGMDDYLSKPVRLKELEAALLRCFSSKAGEAATEANYRDTD
jgi:CheY-like chemotaxis protein